MIPDIELMSVSSLERYLISNVGRIKSMSKKLYSRNRITNKSVAMALGFYHDERKYKIFLRMIKKAKCIENNNGYIKILVDSVIENDKKIIENDTTLKMMASIFRERGDIGVRKERIVNLIESKSDYECSDCLFYDPIEEKCDKTGEKREENDEICIGNNFKIATNVI